MHTEKSNFNPCQEIQYLLLAINTINYQLKKQKTLSLCVKLRATEQVPIRHVAQLWGLCQEALLQPLMVNFIIDP